MSERLRVSGRWTLEDCADSSCSCVSRPIDSGRLATCPRCDALRASRCVATWCCESHCICAALAVRRALPVCLHGCCVLARAMLLSAGDSTSLACPSGCLRMRCYVSTSVCVGLSGYSARTTFGAPTRCAAARSRAACREGGEGGRARLGEIEPQLPEIDAIAERLGHLIRIARAARVQMRVGVAMPHGRYDGTAARARTAGGARRGQRGWRGCRGGGAGGTQSMSVCEKSRKTIRCKTESNRSERSQSKRVRSPYSQPDLSVGSR